MPINYPDALPMGQQIALDLFGPPVLTGLWWLMSRGWANIAQGGNPTERSKVWMNKGAWVLLAIIYCLMIGTTLYAHFVGPGKQ